jgi:tRNA-Thr(GGU) m(6)t(6)A37 methyltransferase TsaA
MNHINPKQTATLAVIGTITTPHDTIQYMPIQPSGAGNISGVAEVFPEFTDGLKDLDGFSNIMLIYHLHEVKGYKLLVQPFMDDMEHGIFSTRSPKRPSPIGISTVRLVKVEGNKIYFEGADMLDGTPLLDIKPFMRQFDNRPHAVSGWLDNKDDDLVMRTRSDSRFI